MVDEMAIDLRQEVYSRYPDVREAAQRRVDFLQYGDNQTIRAARARHELKSLLLRWTEMTPREIADFMGQKATSGVRDIRQIRRPKKCG